MRLTTSADPTAPDSPEVQRLAAFLEKGWGDYRPEGLVNWRPPEEGGAGDGDGGGDGGDGGGSEGGDGGDGDGDDGDGDGEGDEGEGDEDGEGDDGTKAENASLKRRLAESEKKRKAAEKKVAKAQRTKQEEAGEYKEMYEESQRENADLRAQIKNGAFSRAVVAAATSQRFKDPAVAERLLDSSLRDTAVDEDGEVDETLIERELKKLAKKHDYLVRPAERPQGRVNGGDQRRGTSQAAGSGTDQYEFNPDGKLKGAYAGQGSS